MARGKGRSGRRYARDAKGRFAPKGYVGQTGGRGARLKSAGKKREGGGEKTKITATSSKGTLKAKPRSEGQKYARRIQAGKDLRQAQSKADQKKFLAQTQKKLDAAPLAQSSARQAATRAARQRGDAASVNVPMRGSRGRRLDAEISRNVTQQRTAKRAESRARNSQFKSDQSRAKALRGKYGDQLAKDFAAKSGRKVSEVKSTIKGMAPSQQVKLLTKAGREQRAKANLARTADTRNKPGSTMIRRPSAKQSKSNRRAQTAADIYSSSGAKRNQLIRNQARLARTEKARGNQLPTRDVRVAQAKAANLPLIKVTKPKKSDYDMKMKKAPKGRRR